MSPLQSEVKPVICLTQHGGKMTAKGINIQTAPIVKLALRKGYHQHEIAAYFKDNQGRVSEINTGKRYNSVPVAISLPADFPPKH